MSKNYDLDAETIREHFQNSSGWRKDSEDANTHNDNDSHQVWLNRMLSNLNAMQAAMNIQNHPGIIAGYFAAKDIMQSEHMSPEEFESDILPFLVDAKTQDDTGLVEILKKSSDGEMPENICSLESIGYLPQITGIISDEDNLTTCVSFNDDSCVNLVSENDDFNHISEVLCAIAIKALGKTRFEELVALLAKAHGDNISNEFCKQNDNNHESVSFDKNGNAKHWTNNIRIEENGKRIVYTDACEHHFSIINHCDYMFSSELEHGVVSIGITKTNNGEYRFNIKYVTETERGKRDIELTETSTENADNVLADLPDAERAVIDAASLFSFRKTTEDFLKDHCIVINTSGNDVTACTNTIMKEVFLSDSEDAPFSPMGYLINMLTKIESACFNKN